MNTKIKNTVKTVFTIGALLGFVALAGASTWMPPTATPPGANVDEPINIGSTSQTKTGALAVTGLVNWGTTFLSGKSAIGSLAPTSMFGVTSFVAPTLYVKGTSGYGALVADGSTAVYGPLTVQSTSSTGGIGNNPLNINGGNVSLSGVSNHFLENGIRVCLQTGAGCPDTTTTTTGPGGITGTGTSSFIPKFTGASTLGNSSLHDYGAFMSLEAGEALRVDSGVIVNEAGSTPGLAGGVRFGGAASGEGIVSNRTTSDLELWAGGVDRMSIDNSGNITAAGGRSVCLSDGTGCSRSITMYAVINSPVSIPGSSARTCDNLSDDGSTIATSAYSPYGPGTIVTHAYCERSGTYWALPVAGHLNP